MLLHTNLLSLNTVENLEGADAGEKNIQEGDFITFEIV